MGWRAVGESVYEEPEFFFDVCFGESEEAEDMVLKVFSVDSDTAATDFFAVDDEVIGPGFDAGECFGIGDAGDVAGGLGKWVVDGIELALAIIK